MNSVDNFIENTLEDQLKQNYKDDLENGIDSMPVTIAEEEFPELTQAILLAILQGEPTEAYTDNVEALREGVYNMYKEQNGDDVASAMKDHLVYGG